MNQSKLEVITWTWRKAPENECQKVMIGFWFYFWLDKKIGASFSSQSCSVVMQNQYVISELLLPLFQNESWCTIFDVEMRFSCTFIVLQIKLISIWKVA